MGELPPIERRKKGLGANIGFFHQGILTGGIVLILAVVSCTIAVGYYSLQVARSRML